jgi:hypothetical protein
LTASITGAILRPARWRGVVERLAKVSKHMKQWMAWMAVMVLALAPLRAGAADATNAAPAQLPLSGETARIVQILKTRYVDRDKLNDQMLEQASIAGIIAALGQGAVILSEASADASAATSDAATVRTSIARAEVIEPDIGYIRFANVNLDAVSDLDARLREFAAAKVEGYILDLRFANGREYAAAAAVAGRFLEDGRELFVLHSADQGDQVFRATTEGRVTNAGERLADAPLLLLVNSQTRGSAEALAGGLRAVDRGILVGSVTAGGAVEHEDIKLGDGRVLRVATAKVVLLPADPKNLVTADIFPGGLTPDILVPLELSVEREALFSTTTNVTLTVSLQPAPIKKHPSEADLVKAFRGEAVETIGLAPSPSEDEEEEELQSVRDTVLQRAVDIMKGIRMLLSWR